MRNKRRRGRSVPAMEPLDRRVMMAVTASLAGATLLVTGDDQDNVITISRTLGGTIMVNNGAIPIQGGPATVANTSHLHLVGAGGNDNISLNEANGVLPGAALFGGTGNDTLIGGSGIDFVDGEAGNDTISMGAGDDDFQWNPGDGSDVVDGQSGNDTMVFNGSDVAEKFDISDSGIGSPVHHVRLTRDAGTVTMDLSGLETINLNAFGGADTITVGDESATNLLDINLDLSSSAGTGDGQVDAVIIKGTDGDDVGRIASSGSRISANASLSPVVNIAGSEGANDTLTVNALGGDDSVDASSLSANLIGLSLNGGAGTDELFGSQGNDAVNGGTGNDKVFLGSGDDTFVWNPGDGSDVVEGEGGTDTMNFNGSSANENFDISPNGSRVRLTHDVGNVVMDFDGIEQARISSLGGADNFVVNDLTGTALTHVKIGLSSGSQPGSLTINGTNGADTIGVDGDFANGVTISGLAADVDFLGAIGVAQSLIVNSLGGADHVDASPLQAGAISLVINGGAGNDALAGSEGDDTFVWNAGDGNDNVNGQTGADTLRFIGSAGADDVVFNSGSLTAGGFTVTLTSVENRTFDGVGGADHLTITGGTVELPSTQKIASLSISPGGVLDMRDHALIIDYTGASPIATIQSQITSAFAGGAWTGNGITSSTAAAVAADSSNTHKTAVGFAEASELGIASFAGQSVDATALVISYTLAGDANLDGVVDTIDFTILAANFNKSAQMWSHGNFTYDASLDTLDFNLLATNFNQALAAPSNDVAFGKQSNKDSESVEFDQNANIDGEGPALTTES